MQSNDSGPILIQRSTGGPENQEVAVASSSRLSVAYLWQRVLFLPIDFRIIRTNLVWHRVVCLTCKSLLVSVISMFHILLHAGPEVIADSPLNSPVKHSNLCSYFKSGLRLSFFSYDWRRYLLRPWLRRRLMRLMQPRRIGNGAIAYTGFVDVKIGSAGEAILLLLDILYCNIQCK